MDDSQNEAQLMGAGSDHGTFVLLKSHQGHTSQVYSLKEKQPKRLMPLSPNAVVPTICFCRNVVFLGLHTRMRTSTELDSTKSDFHLTNALSATT